MDDSDGTLEMNAPLPPLTHLMCWDSWLEQHTTSTDWGEGLSRWVEKAPIVSHPLCWGVRDWNHNTPPRQIEMRAWSRHREGPMSHGLLSYWEWGRECGNKSNTSIWRAKLMTEVNKMNKWLPNQRQPPNIPKNIGILVALCTWKTKEHNL